MSREAVSKALADSCVALCGGIDPFRFKDHVLLMTFLKYASDRGEDSGVRMMRGYSFDDVVGVREGRGDLGEFLDFAFTQLATDYDLEGVLNRVSFTDVELGSRDVRERRLRGLVDAFRSPDLDLSRVGGDVLGDAFEYLLHNFASEGAKAKGQYYTPFRVSQLLAAVVGIKDCEVEGFTAYDPTCGSGSLVLRAIGESRVRIEAFGQEMDPVPGGLAAMNVAVHGSPPRNVVVGNTLAAPAFVDADGRLRQFDFVVSNPPYSVKDWSEGFDPRLDPRFRYGVPPPKNGDYAFVQHVVASMREETGRAGIVLPMGVLYRGGVEGEIRRRIVEEGLLEGVVALPENVFYGTTIPTCILVLARGRESGAPVRFVDATRGCVRVDGLNVLRQSDVLWASLNYREPGYSTTSRMVDLSEVEANDFNLNVGRYVPPPVERGVDVSACYLGGVPIAEVDELSSVWNTVPGLRETLLAPDRDGYERLVVPVEEVEERVRVALSASVEPLSEKLQAVGDKASRMVASGRRADDVAVVLTRLCRGTPVLERFDVVDATYDALLEAEGLTEVASRSGWASLLGVRDARAGEPSVVVGGRRVTCDLGVEAWRTSGEEEASDDCDVATILAGRSDLEREASVRGRLTVKSASALLKSIASDPERVDDAVVLARVVEALRAADAGRSSSRSRVDDVVAEVTRASSLDEEAARDFACSLWARRLEDRLRGVLARSIEESAKRVASTASRYSPTIPELTERLLRAMEEVRTGLKAAGFSV